MRLRVTKNAVIVTACVIVAFAAGIGANKAWNNQVWRARVSAATHQAAEDYKAKKRAEKVAAEQARLKAECDKSVANYNKLTAIQKKTAEAPNCQNLEIVQ